ncbi:MAG: flavodoxin family protein, partial [Dehalococcoidia bacterium]
MKVIGIVGSPRKNGNTEMLTSHTLRAIEEEGLDTELIRLSGLDIRPCNACMVCREEE